MHSMPFSTFYGDVQCDEIHWKIRHISNRVLYEIVRQRHSCIIHPHNFWCIFTTIMYVQQHYWNYIYTARSKKLIFFSIFYSSSLWFRFLYCVWIFFRLFFFFLACWFSVVVVVNVGVLIKTGCMVRCIYSTKVASWYPTIYV